MRELRLLKVIGEADDMFIESAYIENARISRFPTRAVAAAAAVTIVAAASAIAALNMGGTAVKPDISPEMPGISETAATKAPETTQSAVAETYPVTDISAVTKPDILSDDQGGSAAATCETAPSVTTSAVETAETTSPALTSVVTSPPVTGDDAPLTTTAENPATGMMYGYEGLFEVIGVYSDKVNFVRYEIVKRFTPEEITELNEGFVPPIDARETSLYLAHIEYDYLNEEPVNKDIYLARAGTESSRIDFMPILSTGQKYAGFLMGLSFDAANTCLPELEFMYLEEDGEAYLCQQISDDIKLYSGGRQLGEDIPSGERLYYYNTDDDPFMLVRKYREEELAEFFRADFAGRGFEIKGLGDSIFGTTSKDYEYTEDGDVIPVF